MDVIKTLQGIELFSELEKAELEQLAGICAMKAYGDGEHIFDEDDEGASLFVVAQGAVRLSKSISQGVEKDLLIAGPGMIFGEVSFIDRQPRSALAAVIGDTHVIIMERDDFVRVAEQAPVLDKLFRKLCGIVAERLRLSNDLLKETIIWGLEAAGGAALNLDKIITDSVQVRIDLADGKQVAGKIMRVEKSLAGYEVTVKDHESLSLVPYHAIVRISF